MGLLLLSSMIVLGMTIRRSWRKPSFFILLSMTLIYHMDVRLYRCYLGNSNDGMPADGVKAIQNIIHIPAKIGHSQHLKGDL